MSEELINIAQTQDIPPATTPEKNSIPSSHMKKSVRKFLQKKVCFIAFFTIDFLCHLLISLPEDFKFDKDVFYIISTALSLCANAMLVFRCLNAFGLPVTKRVVLQQGHLILSMSAIIFLALSSAVKRELCSTFVVRLSQFLCYFVPFSKFNNVYVFCTVSSTMLFITYLIQLLVYKLVDNTYARSFTQLLTLLAPVPAFIAYKKALDKIGRAFEVDDSYDRKDLFENTVLYASTKNLPISVIERNSMPAPCQ